MNTSEKIASVIAQFIAADREEDRKRIAELERDAAHLRTEIEQLCRHIKLVEADFAASLEKCAALVVERDGLIGQLMDNGWPCRSTGTAEPVETPAVKRTPKVGDKVRAKLSGRIGVVFKCFESVALVDQGGVMFEVLTSELEVIE